MFRLFPKFKNRCIIKEKYMWGTSMGKDIKLTGTLEQGERKLSFNEILAELYYEQYELIGLSEEEIDIKIYETNDGLKENSKDLIPSIENFIHERRKWFIKIINSLIEDDAYKITRKKGKPFVFTESSDIKDFLQTILSNNIYYQPLRKNIFQKKYFAIAEEDIDILRGWIIVLYTEAGYKDEELQEIINKFDSKFSLEFRKMQKELYELDGLLEPNHISQFEKGDYEYIYQKLQELIEETRNRMSWNKEDQEIIEKIGKKV